MDRFSVQQIDHVEFFVPDRHEAAEWYDRVLGIKIVPDFAYWAEDPGGPLMISPDGGHTKLALFVGDAQGKRQTAGFHRVAFRVDGDGFMAFLTHIETHPVYGVNGDRITQKSVVDHDKSWSIYFCDPWGHRLEVTTYDYDQVAALTQS